MSVFGAIEAGGTKFVCGVGTGPGDLETASFATTTPVETVNAAVSFLRERGGRELKAVGIGSFGPVDLNPSSSTYGFITSSPKQRWRNFDFAGTVTRALNVPVAFETDVDAAALGEARWGAGQGLSDFVYLTVGTGIGGGALVNGRILHGLVHTEMGHIRVPRDRAADPFDGCCPYHGDCLEGLASGPAIEVRWGKRATELPAEHPAWELEAEYLALALANWVCTLSPQRFLLGGGVMSQPHLFPLIRTKLQSLMNGYICAQELTSGMDAFVVPPGLGDRAGVLGALALALAQGETQ